MQDFPPKASASRMRRFVVPTLAIAALALTTQAALAVTGLQPKPQLNVEAERSPQGAKLTFRGKNWMPSARIKITATRAPGSNNLQDFGMFSADDKGELKGSKVAACSTNRSEDGQNESVTFTAADSATGVKATTRVEGGAWVCQ